MKDIKLICYERFWFLECLCILFQYLAEIVNVWRFPCVHIVKPKSEECYWIWLLNSLNNVHLQTVILKCYEWHFVFKGFCFWFQCQEVKVKVEQFRHDHSLKPKLKEYYYSFLFLKILLFYSMKMKCQISLHGIASEIKIHQNLNVFLPLQISIHTNSLKYH